jgi:hypothetical protein
MAGTRAQFPQRGIFTDCPQVSAYQAAQKKGDATNGSITLSFQ